MTDTGTPDARPRCDWDVMSDDADLEQCPELARFAVKRSDDDPAYHPAPDRAPTDTCEAHLAEVIMALMDGNDKIHAAVTPYWD